MSRWDHWGWYTPAPKKPPPKRGIKMKKSGSTWWGQRWIEALERMSFGYSNRLARGRTYARAGRTHDLVVKAGEVTAKVTGSRATPYQVKIRLAKLTEAVWDKAIVAMAGKARFSAELLAGQMPQEIDAAFKEAGASVFPVRETDLATHCNCPDWANPCKHVAATHYVLGEALDRDPFVLFELRGRTKEQVLEALRIARAGGTDGKQASGKGNRRKSIAGDEVPTVSLGKLEAADYDKAREPLPALRFSFEAPPVSGGVLRQLGSPAGWGSDASPVEMLGPMIRAAAERARNLAMAEPDVEADPDLVANRAARPTRPTKTGTTATGATRRANATTTTKKKKASKAKSAAAKPTSTRARPKSRTARAKASKASKAGTATRTRRKKS